MKTFTLFATTLLLAGANLVQAETPDFTFSTGEKVDFPYSRENGDKQCISHVKEKGSKASSLEYNVPDSVVLEEGSYCAYLFYNDEMCGGDVDEMFDVPRKGQAQLVAWDTLQYGQEAAATVIRSGPCPENKPKLVPAMKDEDYPE